MFLLRKGGEDLTNVVSERKTTLEVRRTCRTSQSLKERLGLRGEEREREREKERERERDLYEI